MHFGRGNPEREYNTSSGDERVILENESDKDLGLLLVKSRENNRQAIKSINKANFER